MTNRTIVTQAAQDAFEAGKSSALTQLASGKPILMVDEMGLSNHDFENAQGWNTVCSSPENGELLRTFKSA